MTRRDDPRTFSAPYNPNFVLTRADAFLSMSKTPTTASASGGMTSARQQELLGASALGRAVLAEDHAQDGAAAAATFAAEPTGRHTRAMLARLTPADFADPATLWGPITAQEDVDTIAKLDGSVCLTAAIKANVLAICQRKGLDAPLTWLPPGDVQMTPARQHELLGKSPLGRAMLRGVPLPIGNKP